VLRIGEEAFPEASATFHGRDVFAPARARLASGEDPGAWEPRLGPRRLRFPRPSGVGRPRGEVLFAIVSAIDHEPSRPGVDPWPDGTELEVGAHRLWARPHLWRRGGGAPIALIGSSAPRAGRGGGERGRSGSRPPGTGDGAPPVILTVVVRARSSRRRRAAPARRQAPGCSSPWTEGAAPSAGRPSWPRFRPRSAPLTHITSITRWISSPSSSPQLHAGFEREPRARGGADGFALPGRLTAAAPVASRGPHGLAWRAGRRRAPGRGPWS